MPEKKPKLLHFYASEKFDCDLRHAAEMLKRPISEVIRGSIVAGIHVYARECRMLDRAEKEAREKLPPAKALDEVWSDIPVSATPEKTEDSQ